MVPVLPFEGDLIADRAATRCITSLPRRFRRFELTKSRGRLWALRASLIAPLRAARVAWNAVQEFGAAAHEHLAVTPSRQFLWIWWLNLRHGYDPATAYHFRLFSRDRALLQPLFFSDSQAMWVFKSITPLQSHAAAVILADKRRFAAWCEDQRIPTPPTLMDFEGGSISRDYLGDRTEPSCDLFAKVSTGFGGYGSQRWTWTGEHWLDSDLSPWTYRQIVEFLATRSTEGVIVLQPCLVNHPALRDLSRNALSTIRLMTTRRPRAKPQFLAGVFKMGTGQSTVDNFSQGGIASAIDCETGTLDAAISLDKQNLIFEHEVHPDTGAPIAGRQLPFWREAIDMALNAHSRLGDVPCVGWDVALLESGPVLVEGNWQPSVELLQMPTRTPILMTEFARTFAAWLNEPGCSFDDSWLYDHRHWSPLGKRSRKASAATSGLGFETRSPNGTARFTRTS